MLEILVQTDNDPKWTLYLDWYKLKHESLFYMQRLICPKGAQLFQPTKDGPY